MDTLYKFQWFSQNIKLDFSGMQLIEKMPTYQQDQYWFGFYQIYSNYMQANIEPLLLLFFLLIKFCFLKLIVMILPKSISIYLNMNWDKLLHHFVRQLSCFVPFFIISAYSELFALYSDHAIGKFNSFLQVFTVFVIMIISFLSLVIKLLHNRLPDLSLKSIKTIRTMQIMQKNSSSTSTKQKTKVVKAIEGLSFFWLGIIIPLLIVFGNKTLFFLLSTPYIYWRCLYAFRNRIYYSRFQKVFQLLSYFSWVTFHTCFLILFIIELTINSNSIQNTDTQTGLSSACDYIGYTIIIMLVLGAVTDLVLALCLIFKLIIFIIKKVYRKCKGKSQ